MKKAFLLYQDYRSHLDLISDDSDFRLLIEYIFNFADDKESDLNLLSPAAKMAFSFISQSISRDKQKYEKTVKSRAEAGSKGGLAKSSKRSKAKQGQAKVANVADKDNVIDTDKDNVIDTDRDNVKEKGTNKYKGDIDDDTFEKLKEHVPKRDGTNNMREARRHINARLKEGHAFRELCMGLLSYRDYCERTDRVGSEYVMTMSRFFGRDKHFLENWEKKGRESNQKNNKLTPAGLNTFLRNEAKMLVKS